MDAYVCFRALRAAFRIETEMLLIARRLARLFLIGVEKIFIGSLVGRRSSMPELAGLAPVIGRSDGALQGYDADFNGGGNH